MSFDVYDSEQVIHYGSPAVPTDRTYYGWRVSMSNDAAEGYPFHSAAGREAWVTHITDNVPKMGAHEARELAACLALSEWLDGETERQSLRDFTFERWEGGYHSREWDDIMALAEDFDPSEWEPKEATA